MSSSNVGIFGNFAPAQSRSARSPGRVEASRQAGESTTEGPTGFHHSAYLTRDGVRLADLVPPVASPHRDNGELGQDDGPADGSGYFL